jgi:tetratricopeptide (TPR) repeat protein
MPESAQDRNLVQEEAPAVEKPSADSADARKFRGWLLLVGIGVVLVAGAVGVLGWRVFSDSGRLQQAPIAQEQHLDRRRQAGAASTLPPAASQPATAEPPPVAPDLPPPETVEEILDEAEQTADRLVGLFPNDPDAFEVKARAHYYVGDYPAASECWEQCLGRQPSYAYAYHGLGLVAAKKADYEEAAAHQRKAFELAPGFIDAAVELADTLMKLGNLDEAIEVLEKHLDVSSRSALGHLTLGHAYLQAKEYRKARDAYRAALQLQPEMPRAQFGLATALARLGEKEEARRAMQRYKELEARKIEVRRNLRSQFDDLGAVCVDVGVHFTHAARVCLAHTEPAEAERLCRRAATLDPNNTECRILLASLYQQTGRGEQSLEMCRQLTRIEPDSPQHLLHLGILCGNLGRLDEAEEAFNEVIRLVPQRAEARVALVRLYLHGGRKVAEAARLAREAARIQPTAPNYYLLAQACAAGGDRAQAVSAIQKAIDLDPANQQYREVLQRIQERE